MPDLDHGDTPSVKEREPHLGMSRPPQVNVYGVLDRELSGLANVITRVILRMALRAAPPAHREHAQDRALDIATEYEGALERFAEATLLMGAVILDRLRLWWGRRARRR